MNQKNQKRKQKQKQKRLIASMGSFAVTFSLLIPPTYAVEMEQVNVPEVVTSNQAGTLSETSGVGPYLQISEIVFNSKDHSSESESYEYIELYNASNTAIALKDYKLLYNNWSVQKNEWEFTTDKILQPGEVVVVWNKKRGQTATVDDFIKNYGSPKKLSSDQIITLEPSGSFVNTGGHYFTLVAKSGTVVSKATYNEQGSSTDTSDNLDHTSVIYKAAPNDDVLMTKAGSKVVATPGFVLNEQSFKPVIKHSVPTKTATPHDLTITADVTSDYSAIQEVKLFYKKEEDKDYTSIPMTKSDGQYSAVIPKKAMARTEKIQYYIEATDEKANVTTTTEWEGTAYEIQIFSSEKPNESGLMITEILPANVGTEKYEYLEVYNTTNKDINLEDYKIIHENRSASATLLDIPTDFVLKAQETAVIWLKTYASKDETIADFNAHYGVDLDESQVLPIDWSDGIGLNDSAEGRLLIAPDAAYPIHHEADEIMTQAWFSVKQDDAIDGKSVVYEYAKDGSNRMLWRNAGQEPTPGKLLYAQVPNTPVNVKLDTKKPTITHEPLTTEQENVDFKLETTVTDNQALKQVSLYYKRDGESEYTRVHMLHSEADKFVSETIPRYRVLNAKYIDYYITASDGFNTVSTLDQSAEPYRLTFKQQEDSFNLNIEEGQLLRGTQNLEGQGQPTESTLSLSVDGKPLDTQRSLPKDSYILFQAYDMQSSFKNGLFINDELASYMPSVSNYNYEVLPLPKDMLKPGENKITLTSGNSVGPKELDGNNDDYYLQNVQAMMWNGEKLAIKTAQSQTDKGKLTTVDPITRIKIQDTLPQIHYTVDIPESAFTAITSKLDTTTLTDGEHQLKLTSTDGKSVSVKAVIDNTAPIIESTSVEEGKSYKEPVTLNVTASDATSGVDKITALLDGEPVELSSSPTLDAGEHTFEVNVTDKAGNVTTKKISFTTENKNPDQPTEAQPSGDVTEKGNDAQLSVKVSDPNGDPMDVSFYKAYKYDFAADSKISAYSNSTDREPPLELVPSGEEAFSNDAIAKVKEKDGQYFVTDADGEFPYHRFDFKINKKLSPEDEVEVVWNGHSLEGRQVTMYTWNYNTKKWQRATSGIGSEDFQLKAKVNAGDMVRNNVIHVLIQDLFPSPDDVDFTFAWISDTQYYSDSYKDIYKQMNEYLANQKEEKKIVYSLHTGDIVDDWNRPDEWAAASESMKILDDAGMNYGVVAGNHDVNFSAADYSEYHKYFGRERFEDQPTYGDDNGNNRDHYDLVSQNGQDFIIMYLGWDVQKETIEWANDVLKKYPDRYAIIATHSYITPSGAYGNDGYGERIWTDIVAPNKNVSMVLCGHFHGVAYNVKHTSDGRTVVEMLSDYQSGLEGGGGYIRFLQFDLDNQKIHVNTYSPYLDDENYFDDGTDEFDVDYPKQATEKQVATDYIGVNVYTKEKIGSSQDVESGSTATALWKQPSGNSFLSWYTSVTDAYGGKTVSDVWRFKTGAVSKSGKTYNLAGFKKKKLVVKTPNSLINLDGSSPITEGIVLKASATLRGEGNADTTVTIDPTKKDAVIDFSGAVVKEVKIINAANVKEIKGAENVQKWTYAEGIDPTGIIFLNSKGEEIPSPLK